ncbi:class I SAM-dependent methyltransferase [Candidatus Peregrinibacteria bacterium]|nr:class I SAM-dependent methyltransferase [Candidatus Peregrinibacteria bacterium]
MNKKIRKILRDLEKTRNIYWNISRATGQFLNLLVKELALQSRHSLKILEIGASNGYSGIWLAEALKANKGHLYTMESHAKKRFHLARENFTKSGLRKYITQILGHAPEDLPITPKFFDLIFLDCTKEEYLSCFEALKNRIHKGSLLLADNLYSHPEALADFVAAIKSASGWQVFELNLGTGVLVGIKN